MISLEPATLEASQKILKKEIQKSSW